MNTGITEFGLSDKRKENEYFNKYLLEGIAATSIMVDTFLDLEHASDMELEEQIENLVEQMSYIDNLTNKTFMQQLEEVTQDAILDAKLYLQQVRYRHEYLSSGRLTKSPKLVLSTEDPEEKDLTWESTRKLALRGIYKYILSVTYMINEADIEEDDSIVKGIKRFNDLMEEEDFLSKPELETSSSDVLQIDYYLDSENEEGSSGDSEDDVSFVNFGDFS